jgi:hypothetical protein
MNRSILIVICDFLLLSLLAFSTVDINKTSEEGSQRSASMDIVTNQVENSQDLAAVLKVALNEEQKNREQLVGELARARLTTSQQLALLSEREKQAETLQQKTQALQQQTQSLEKQTQSLQEQVQTREQEAGKLKQQQEVIQQQYLTAQTNLQKLSQQVQQSSTDALISKEKLAAMEDEAKKKAEEAASLQKQLSQISQSNQVAAVERERLSGQLQLAESERRHASEQVVAMQQQVQAERAEKAKLAEGVKVLANKSSELAQEVRENRPLAPNTIFNDFVTNRVATHFVAARPGIFGEASKNKDTQTVLVSNGTNFFALCHVQDTPLTLFNPGTDWEKLSGTLARGTTVLPIHSVAFSLHDPRVVLIPLSEAEAKSLGGRTYPISASPYKFQDAVLVGAREGYYGECRFQIDLGTPDYLKLDRSFLKGLFGKFNPSRGDLVFARTGELIGVMANSSYCLMLHDFNAAAAFPFNQNLATQHTGDMLARLYSMVMALPPRLQ